MFFALKVLILKLGVYDVLYLTDVSGGRIKILPVQQQCDPIPWRSGGFH